MARLTIPQTIGLNTDAFRDLSTQLLAQIVAYFHSDQEPINEIIIVPLLIGARIFRTYDAINTLLKAGYISEAAILTLTQFELRLDLAYTAHDVTHATEWLDHDNLSWGVAQKMENKIKSLFTDPNDIARLSDVFKYLSGIKHGNPRYSALGYPARRTQNQLEITTGEFDDDFSSEFSQHIASYSKFQLAWTAQVLNVCTGRYAVIDETVRKEVREYYLALEPSEELFRRYLENLLAESQGAFGLRRWRKMRNSSTDL